MGRIDIRRGSPSELPLVVAIDDDASRRYALGGLSIELADDHPFVVAERRRWVRSLSAGRVLLAEVSGEPVGLAVLGTLDGDGHLDQLSVRLAAMRAGVGSALLSASLAWARERAAPLVLTTYRHLEWNAPFYARRGFAEVPEREWGPELRAIVAAERASLPDPDERMVMRSG